jgi:hypothetical protein
MTARMGSKPLDCEPDMRMNVHLSYAGTER